MNRLLGRIFYYITWPGIFLIIKLQPPRTRIIIKNKNNILLVKDWLGTGKWSLPGGGLKRNENPKEGAIREIREETGLILNTNDLQSIGQINLKSAGIGYSAYCYLLNVNTNLKPNNNSKEIAEVSWFNLDSIEKLNLSPTVYQVLQALYNKADLLK